ncbi:MAG: hypothetical protein JW801_17360 [Bacteroidales bacterium]|nr:hypothetical protein [Bacteroidales bacterium]
MQKVLLSLLFLFIGLSSKFSQYTFEKGYIITLEQDTVHGLAGSGNTKTNAQICIFKTEEKAQPEKYTPGEILAYNINDRKHYVSKLVKEGKDESEMFLEYLMDGSIDLYFYTNDLNCKSE